MKHRNIDAGWDTDEPYLRFNSTSKYREVKFNDFKGYVAGSFIELKNGGIQFKKEFLKEFKNHGQPKPYTFVVTTKKSHISSWYENIVSNIAYLTETNENLTLDFVRSCYSSTRTKIYRITTPNHKCSFTIGEYGDVELFGEVVTEDQTWNFIDGKANCICGMYKYDNGVLDYEYLKKRLKVSYFSDETISKVAYEIWEKEGRPNGKSEWHWQEAKWHMEALYELDFSFIYDVACILPGMLVTKTKELLDGIINETA